MTNDEFFLSLLRSRRLEVTTDGRVRNRTTGNWLKGGGKRYLNIEFRDDDGRLWYIGVHRLVYLAIHGPIQRGHTVNHKDGRRKHNHPSNLEAGPHSDNIKHSYRTGLQPPIPVGESHWGAKLTDQQVAEIRRRRAATSCRALGREFNVSHQLVSCICRGERRNKPVRTK